jgi:phage terminase large subunit-like protein
MPVATPKKPGKSPKRPKIAHGRPIPAKWQRLMRLLPGYDPVATAPPGYYFDAAAAQAVVDFFRECLRHVEGEHGGEPFVLEPWQQAIVGCLYGWKRPDGRRRYRELWLYIPKKNGKTFLLGGLVLYTLLCDPEAGIKAFSAASDKDQAGLVFTQVRGMILQEPLLKARLPPRRSSTWSALPITGC